ncbi:MAG TPA: family 20 glycosylhydrolase [Terriglobia bacterium]|nr:family 20 glycosylhydrolase [Terriglobia bacterium]
MRFQRPLLFAAFMLGTTLRGQQPNMMPLPAEIKPSEGRLVIDGSFHVGLTGYQEARLQRAADRFLVHLGAETGIPLADHLEGDALESDATKATLVVDCDHAGETVQSVKEDESYALEVGPKQARLTAPDPVGVMRGLATFLQLVDLDSKGFGVPAVAIHDRPRFQWRGLMIDVGRHWMPVDAIERNLDAMELLKLNVFHWHLSDDQGFRVESKVFPKLQEMGSDGHYYSQQQVKDVIAYARDRGIRVIPEFDMPGHSTAWFVGYPELASAPGPYSIERKWGILDACMNPANEKVYEFLDAFIGEMAALFPDEDFHVGGDEVNGVQWKASPEIQAFMQQHGIKSSAALQAYFSARVVGLVEKHGKRTVGWDEVLQPGVPTSVVVQSWRGQKSLAEAARQGYAGILSAGYYLDLMQPASRHYGVDPMEGATAGLTPEEQSRILGGEACLWSEYVTPQIIDAKIWPRMAAIAERLWSPQQTKEVDSMYARLARVSRLLDFVGLEHRSSYPLMLERLTDFKPIDNLRTFDEILEPVKGYSREEMRSYNSSSPLNRLVDATPAESDRAREFAKLVADWSAHKDEIKSELTMWRNDGDDVLPVLQGSALLEEDIPLAQDLAALAAAGLEALEYLESGKPAPQPWVTAQLALVDRTSKPRAELLIMIAKPIGNLIQAAKQ